MRARHGDARYQWLEGPDAGLLQLVLRVTEPIPALDTFVESDWRINRETVDGVKTTRVLSGYESPEGVLDPEHARGYWFDENGNLLITYFLGIQTRRLEFADFKGAQVAHEIRVLRNGTLGMLIRVTEITSAGDLPESTFDLPGHQWKRAFTDEVR